MYKFPALYLLLENGLNGRESRNRAAKKQLSDPFPPRFKAGTIVNVQKFGSADSLFPVPVFVNWKV